MKISLNEIKKLVPEAEKVETTELVRLIGSRLVEVEGTDDWSEKYSGVKIVKVVECEAIPETHLHLCQIDTGTEKVQVVCGAPNVRKGMLAAWVMPGTKLPADPTFELGVRKLRGYESSGMLAAEDELALGSDHDGILEIAEGFAKAGDSFAEKFELNDVILDIENKSLTHRPDCFGLIGFAREVAGILGAKFKEPTLKFGELTVSMDNAELLKEFTKAILKDDSSGANITVKVADAKLCAAYSAMVFEIDAETMNKKPQCFSKDAAFLAKAGMRSVDPIVDATNIVMLMTGQPLHAFDYDKFVEAGGSKDGAKVGVRAAKAKEKLELLDGKTVVLNEDDIVITSGDTAVALAGAMGGKATEIDMNTKRVILESATFSLYNLRKTQMAHGIFSEAITRFTKGQPASGTIPAALATAARLISGPEQVEGFALDSEQGLPAKTIEVEVTLDDINSLLGTDYSASTVKKTLENVGFVVRGEKGEFVVEAPAWRMDIKIREDVIEEVGRLLGFDNIEPTLPLRPFKGPEQPKLWQLKNQLRDILSDKLRANEVLSYSFVSKDLQEKVGENPSDSYEITNSISPELQVFRQSIVPSLLVKAHDNVKAGFSDFALYEFNQVTSKKYGLNEEKVPAMREHLAAVVLGDYYAAKTLIVETLRELGFPGYRFPDEESAEKYFTRERKDEGDRPAYFEPKHAAPVSIMVNVPGMPKVEGAEGPVQNRLGYVGAIRGSVLRALKIEQSVAAFEIDLEELAKSMPTSKKKNLRFSKFPSVSRDLTIKVASDLAFQAVEETLARTLEARGLIYKVRPLSIYQDKKTPETKNLSFRLTFASEEATLTTDEISAIMNDINSIVVRKFSAKIV